MQLVPLSESNFSGFYGLGIGLVMDKQGKVEYLLERRISKDYRFRPKK